MNNGLVWICAIFVLCMSLSISQTKGLSFHHNLKINVTTLKGFHSHFPAYHQLESESCWHSGRRVSREMKQVNKPCERVTGQRAHFTQGTNEQRADRGHALTHRAARPMTPPWAPQTPLKRMKDGWWEKASATDGHWNHRKVLACWWKKNPAKNGGQGQKQACLLIN